MRNPDQDIDTAITDINLTPLVDVALVLVIIFMAVAPLALKTGINILHSKAGASQGKAAVGQNVTVKLDRTGLITVNGHAAQAVPDALRNMIAAALDASADRLVIVTADDENRVGEVVRILDVSKQAGALKLAVMKNG